MGLDEQEKTILSELIKDPRISDNQIAIKTGMPVKSVNRKRHKLEESGTLNYFVNVDHGSTGTKEFGSKKMYILLFNYGISRQMFLERFPNFGSETWEAKHIDQIMIGEYNGRFALIMIVESRLESDIIEIFNVEIMRRLKEAFGEGVIHDTLVFPVDNYIKIHHNYTKTNGKMHTHKNIFV